MSRYAGPWASLAWVALSVACGNSSGSGLASASGGVAGAANGGSAGNAANGGSAGNPASGGNAGNPASGGSFANGGSAGNPGSGGTTAESGGSAGASAGAGGASATNLCPELPTPRAASGTIVEIPIHLTLQGKPFLFGEANAVSGGGNVTPLDVRFYISSVALLRANADALPVDVVTAAGTVAPYGIYFYRAEDDASTTLRVLAPAGEYSGISFSLGLLQACNTQNPEVCKAPLSATSQMTWPHTGYLFLRYQGRYTAAAQGSGGAGSGGAGSGGAGSASAGSASAGSGGAAGAVAAAGAGGAAPNDTASMFPPVIHMGGSLLEARAPAVRVDGSLSVPSSGTLSKSLLVSMDEIFRGALSNVDLTGFDGPPGEEVILGERLRRSMPTLNIFSFGP